MSRATLTMHFRDFGAGMDYIRLTTDPMGMSRGSNILGGNPPISLLAALYKSSHRLLFG